MTADVAIIGGRVVTGLGDDIEGATVLVQGGRISGVGIDVEVPDDVRTIDASGAWVLPGLIDAHSHIGAHEEANGAAGFDGSEVTSPNTAGVRAIDAINIEDIAFRDALAGGVTTVVVKPGSGNPIGGQSVAIKTGGGPTVDARVVRADVSVKSALGENPKETYGKRSQMPATRLGIAYVIRQALLDAQDYAVRRAKAGDDGTPFARDLGKEALVRALSGELSWDQHVHRHDDIATALRIADEFGLRLVLNHGTEAHKLAEVLAERDVPVIFGPILSSRSKVEVREADPSNLATIAAAGVRIALTTDHPVVPIGHLALQAAVAVRAGLPRAAAIAAMTSSAAEIVRIDDRTGALDVGRDGDVVIWSGDPLDVASRVLRVFIDGVEVHAAEAGG
ncbi:imidazolonepropionase-like amidohydrolase [Microbacterium phyllosphaerae]|uniref:Imidazolonepropionase-like amidohydrolase n=1 Tax=Microbacterium phyllosphaerae TaxID=124798 RepID=A0ABS4WPE9_9MICO|nr:amidohydrolase [Microbacterium phyllosphaerae]MBP2378073.1 imidazolonepropionase-like amidohydrolase [Microbacterium phyllosphaerae]